MACIYNLIQVNYTGKIEKTSLPGGANDVADMLTYHTGQLAPLATLEYLRFIYI